MKYDSQDCINLNQSANVNQCPNTNVAPAITPAGTRILRVPVTLAEIAVSSNLVANVTFPEPVLEIKDVKKRVKVVHCRLLLPSAPPQFAAGPYPLFLKGYVRKNIQYATPSGDASGSCVSSDIRSLTIDVPFECMTQVTLNLSPAQLPVLNTRSEFDFFRAQSLGIGYPEKDHLLSSDLSQFHQSSTQFYNQLPYCELISSNILQYDESTDREPLQGNAPFEEGFFYNMVEKMSLQFSIKVLQNQQVRVTAL
ncbi:CsxC family protein [Bacillus sp. FJAT-45066]|uniref:CsxC family protein n=1 Tax=Bacillus sp. FJAT-45066 TaxID=2011010 RepID=UPI000BB91E3E|nr:DUF3794 domain-containing protein [Bacillus sp. FJAT-45066]